MSAARDTYFLLYQQRWIKDGARLKIVEKSRQIGLSYADSYDSVRKAAAANSLAKLSKSNIEVQKYKDANARALKLLEDAKKTSEKGGLSAETIEKIERELKLL